MRAPDDLSVVESVVERAPPSSALSPEERISRLERRANVVRSRLVRAVAALDTRRQQVAEVGRQAKRLVGPALVAAAGVTAVLGLAVGFALVRKRKTLGQRVTAELAGLDLGRFVRREPTLGRRLLERTALTLASVAAGEIGRRVAKNAADGRLPDGRLAVGRALAIKRGATGAS